MLAAAAAVLLGACGSEARTATDTAGDGTDSRTTDSLPGLDEGVMMPTDGSPVVQLRVQGQFPVVQPFLQTGWIAIYADGTVLLPSRANAFAQPQVWPYDVGHVDKTDIGALLMHAKAYGLLEPPTDTPSQPTPPTDVADAPMTTLVLSSDTDSVTHRAIGLGQGADPTDNYRKVLMKVVGEISDLVNTSVMPADGTSAPSAFYEATELDVIAVDVTEVDTGNGTPTVIEWGGDADLSTWTSCTTIDDPADVSFLVGQLAGPKFQQGDRLYRIASRVHPPGTSCD